ncbi:FAD-binding oxidoreductase [Aquella oligotrophica]|uniref:FAD-binding oxidoreductase n=1 Tax=Aquella oligotrophica TaxID=2067065 RepID=A0A2I7N583_9NEIS|nr:FAD-binding oxidoreductase [Aquella oligotrophica]AUR51610.1 FAD-binding oxidoreductase [Aquella oligotrophica]
MIEQYSWGRIKASKPAQIDFPSANYSFLQRELQYLAKGNLRSYGDEAYNDNGIILNTLHLDHFIHFDRANGVLELESGVLLEQILNLIVPCGWFLPVTPGTKYITVGGAVANDVHGKNHHKVGSFGCFVDSFTLLRSDGLIYQCSRELNSHYFYATIGGMGLTGIILRVKLNLLTVNNHAIVTKAYKFRNLEHYMELNAELERQSTYTVAWIDCLASGRSLGRGVYYTGEHAGYLERLPAINYNKRTFPFTPTKSLINGLTLKAFNTLYYNRPVAKSPQLVHYDPFFYPLDKLLNWNRIYGRKGFYQYQCVIPNAASDAMREILRRISISGNGSFLAVLKTFGSISSGGMMSFPRPGLALALDFANRGNSTLDLFRSLDDIVLTHGGAIYAAKDATQSREVFEAGYPQLNEFIKYIDPLFSSNLWRRLYGN